MSAEVAKVWSLTSSAFTLSFLMNLTTIKTVTPKIKKESYCVFC
tara:strand:+ start:368 stop:499 length:132 start_codon:yes stop_codon:yes gene_type:complete